VAISLLQYSRVVIVSVFGFIKYIIVLNLLAPPSRCPVAANIFEEREREIVWEKESIRRTSVASRCAYNMVSLLCLVINLIIYNNKYKFFFPWWFSQPLLTLWRWSCTFGDDGDGVPWRLLDRRRSNSWQKPRWRPLWWWPTRWRWPRLSTAADPMHRLCLRRKLLRIQTVY